MVTDYLPWSRAWQQAAFASGGFYLRHQPHEHFTTNVMSGHSTGEAMAHVAAEPLGALAARYGTATVTDFGTADGRLLAQLMDLLPRELASRITWRAVDVRGRPSSMAEDVAYVQGDARSVATQLTPTPGLAIAHELLDDVPCDIVEIDDEGCRRVVLVDEATGHELLGPDLDDSESCARIGVDAHALTVWCDEWWPRREPAARIEVGVARDNVWRSITATVSDGLAIAVDYGHVLVERVAGRWDGGTLTGFKAGRVVRPIPDGSVNLTAHVAIDSCAAASGACTTHLATTSDGLWTLVQQMGR